MVAAINEDKAVAARIVVVAEIEIVYAGLVAGEILGRTSQAAGGSISAAKVCGGSGGGGTSTSTNTIIEMLWW